RRRRQRDLRAVGRPDGTGDVRRRADDVSVDRARVLTGGIGAPKAAGAAEVGDLHAVRRPRGVDAGDAADLPVLRVADARHAADLDEELAPARFDWAGPEAARGARADDVDLAAAHR